jgi:hypothetical protein
MFINLKKIVQLIIPKCGQRKLNVRSGSQKNNQIKKNEIGVWAHGDEKRSACRVLVRKPEGKGSLTRPRYRWEANINGS